MELDRVLESPNFINKNPRIKRRSLGIGLVNPTSKQTVSGKLRNVQSVASLIWYRPWRDIDSRAAQWLAQNLNSYSTNTLL